jgi:peptidoglycan/LPS O-acetylase OafA/YrhL
MCVANDADHAAQFHLGYRRWLDGLRGVAILLVLAFHFRLIPGGWLGVDIFFVLSGFLITTLLAEEWQRRGSISLKHFYLRRALRLLPAFLTLLMCYLLISLLFPPAAGMGARLREVLVAACYVANWPGLHQTNMPVLGHTWSLSVEEQFYLLWPLLFFLMLRLGLSRRRILTLVGAGIIVSAALRIVLYRMYPVMGPEKAANIMRLYMGLDTRADALLVGCLTGLLATWGMLPRSRRFLFWGSLTTLGAALLLGYLALTRSMEHSQFYHGLFTAVAFMAACNIARLLAGPLPLVSPALECRPLIGIGRISYGLYLFHIPVLALLPLDLAYPVFLFMALVGTFACAGLCYFLIERPCLRLKSRLENMHNPAANAARDKRHGTEKPVPKAAA